MRSMLLSVASGLFCAACLLAGLPSATADLPEDEAETLLDPEHAGDVVWKHQLGTPGGDYAIGVATDAAGNVLIGSSFVDFVNNLSVPHTIGVKYSPAGKRLRTRELGSVGPAGYTSMTWDSAGDFLVASTGGIDLYGLEYFVAKYSPAGDLLWTDHQYDGANDVATDAAGNVLIGGQTNVPAGCCDSGAVVAKYSPAGRLVWTRTLYGYSYFVTIHVIGRGVATDAAGNVVIAGYTYGYEEVPYAFVAKYNTDGVFRWARKLALGDYTAASAVAADAAGNIVMVGTGGGFEWAERDAFVAKYSPAGKLLWTRRLGSSEGDEASGVAIDFAGNIIMVGSTGGSLGGLNEGSDDLFVAKYRPWGKRLWTRHFGTQEFDGRARVATDAAGNIVIAGLSLGPLGGPIRGNGDVFVLKLRP